MAVSLEIPVWSWVPPQSGEQLLVLIATFAFDIQASGHQGVNLVPPPGGGDSPAAFSYQRAAAGTPTTFVEFGTSAFAPVTGLPSFTISPTSFAIGDVFAAICTNPSTGSQYSIGINAQIP